MPSAHFPFSQPNRLPAATNASVSGELGARFAAVRTQTLALAAPLYAEDCALQSMPDASPVKWHLGHTTWFFETFVLEVHAPGYAPFDAAFRGGVGNEALENSVVAHGFAKAGGRTR